MFQFACMSVHMRNADPLVVTRDGNQQKNKIADGMGLYYLWAYCAAFPLIFLWGLWRTSIILEKNWSISTRNQIRANQYTVTKVFIRYLVVIKGSNYIRVVVVGGVESVELSCSALGLLINRSTDRSCTSGMIRNKIHLISSGCFFTPSPVNPYTAESWPKTLI